MDINRKTAFGQIFCFSVFKTLQGVRKIGPVDKPQQLHNMKTHALLIAAALLALAACSGGDPVPQAGIKPDQEIPVKGEVTQNTGQVATKEEALKTKGLGKFTNVELTNPLNQTWVTTGQGIYDLKCAACHKLTDQKLVGPGWKDVTSRRTPEWIMNFSTNVDEMLAKDPEALAMLEECMVRMPNQNLSDDDARAVLEYMRHNDGVK
jgi:cytochrome c551/c552